jgi:hypothetical protein
VSVSATNASGECNLIRLTTTTRPHGNSSVQIAKNKIIAITGASNAELQTLAFVGLETAPPTVFSVNTLSNTSLLVTYSEDVLMDETSSGGLNKNNYSIAGLIVKRVTQVNSAAVQILTSQMASAVAYDLVITNVKDVNGNTIA